MLEDHPDDVEEESPPTRGSFQSMVAMQCISFPLFFINFYFPNKHVGGGTGADVYEREDRPGRLKRVAVHKPAHVGGTYGHKGGAKETDNLCHKNPQTVSAVSENL